MKLYRPFSPKFPYPPKYFVGRDEDMKELIRLIDFSNKTFEIICIVGSPGIGKSALAISVGNEMILNGAVVHYVNMAECPEGQLKQALAEKILHNLNKGSLDNATFDRLLTWAGNRFWSNLIVLDNCINNITQKPEFHDAINDILAFSSDIKILTTSREEILDSELYYVHKLAPLSKESACNLLDQKMPFKLNKTEKEKIAELTGEVPLALQIIGSLLNIKVAPPTPEEIITKLEKNLIQTLSPPLLTRNMNYSISLSYNFLDNKLQKIASYLAHFPGSFDESAAINVLTNIYDIVNADYFLDELVIRSLLEYNQETGRYHYHKLIKSFLFHSNQSDARPFNLTFQLFFSKALCTLTATFLEAKSPKILLSTLDVERHNFQYLMSTIQNPVNQSHPNYEKAIECFAYAMYSNYLQSRFSPQELIKPVRSAVSTLRAELKANKNLSMPDNLTHFVNVYHGFVRMTILFASLTETLKGMEQAVQVYLKRIELVEKFGNLTTMTDREYIKFYSNLLEFKSELSNSSVMLYHERILKKQSKLDCNIGMCNYYDFGSNYYKMHDGSNYYKMHDYEKSIKFYEKALSSEGYSVPVKVNALLTLRIAYLRKIYFTKADEVRDTLISMYPQMMNEALAIVYGNYHSYLGYSMFLSTISMPDESAMVQERLIEALVEVGTQGDIVDIIKVYHVAERLYNDKEYARAKKVASYALSSSEYTDTLHFIEHIVKIHMVHSKSIYYMTSNSSEAEQSFKDTMEYLITNNITYESHFVECCSYLLFLGNFDYADTCYYPYFNAKLQQISSILQGFTYFLFVIPLDPIPKALAAENEEFDLPIEKYPQVIKQSKSREVLFNDKTSSALTYDFPEISSVTSSNIASSLIRIANRLIGIAKWLAAQSTIIRFILNCHIFLLNFHTVFFRLSITYIILKYCFCYFPRFCYRKIVYSAVSIVAALYSIFIFILLL